jgi:hypothetical protein
MVENKGREYVKVGRAVSSQQGFVAARKEEIYEEDWQRVYGVGQGVLFFGSRQGCHNSAKALAERGILLFILKSGASIDMEAPIQQCLGSTP